MPAIQFCVSLWGVFSVLGTSDTRRQLISVSFLSFSLVWCHFSPGIRRSPCDPEAVARMGGSSTDVEVSMTVI